MKKYKEQLAVHLAQSSEIVKKMAISYEHIANFYKIIEVPKLSSIFEAISFSFEEMNKHWKQYQECSQRNFIDSFNYPNEELKEIFKAFKSLFDDRKQFKGKYDILMERKESLFDKKNINSWEVDSAYPYPPELLYTNKKLAFSAMLPRATKEVDELRSRYGYFLNKLLEEYSRISERHGRLYYKNLIASAEANRKTFTQVNEMWNDIIKKNISENS